MNECCAAHSQHLRCVTTVFGKQFKYEADVCLSCGKIAWTDELKRKFAAWLKEKGLDASR